LNTQGHNPLLILLESGESTRLRYALDFVFLEVLKLPYKTLSFQDFQASKAHVQYCASKEKALDGPLMVPDTKLLYAKGVQVIEPACSGLGPNFTLFNQEEGFDLFSMVFFLLTRMEEYHPHQKDRLGRIQFRDFYSLRYQFSHLPLLDQHIHAFYRKIRVKFPSLPEIIIETKTLMGIDIDHIYLHANLPLYWKIPALLKSLYQGNFDRFRKIWHPPPAEKDPYAQHAQWAQPILKSNAALNVFVLSHRFKGRWDRNTCHTSPWFGFWIRELMRQFPIVPQWHPSVQSHRNFRVLKMEKQVLEQITGQRVTISRQHFLHVKMPETYRKLLSLGILEDHSMGFYDRVGFRASTAHAHYWYDLNKEEITTLRLIPPCLMDVQLKNYMKLTPEQGLQTSKELKATLDKTGGYFSVIWHNSSFEPSMGWEGWDQVFRALLKD
jgi:hypothetical protein